MFSFDSGPTRRRPGLTPMIDVVFLLLVFFMLAAQFGQDTALPIAGGEAGGDYSGPPRLVSVTPDRVLLNGIAQPLDTLPEALAQLMENIDDAIVLRPRDGADVQRLTEIVDHLRAAGFTRLILVE